jgi:hypothetical protein
VLFLAPNSRKNTQINSLGFISQKSIKHLFRAADMGYSSGKFLPQVAKSPTKLKDF